VFVWKYDANGNEVWTKQFGTPGIDEGYGVAVDTSENIYITGATQGTLSGQAKAGGLDAFVVKLK
jgi:hypothetical protein